MAILESACDSGNLQLVQYVIDNTPGEYIRNEIFYAGYCACEGGHLPIVQLLHKYGLFESKTETEFGKGRYDSIIRTVSQYGHLDILQFLLNNGLTVDDYRRSEVLIGASECGHLDIVEFLLEKGLTIDDIRARENQALQRAARNGHTNIVKHLLSVGLSLEDIRACDNHALRLASANGHLETIKALIEHGLTREDIDSCHALSHAARNKHHHIVKYYQQLFKNTN